MSERTSQDIAKQILDYKIDGRVPHESRSFRDALDGRVEELLAKAESHTSHCLYNAPGVVDPLVDITKRNMHVETSMQGLRKILGETSQMQSLRTLLGDVAIGKPLDGIEKTKFQFAWQQAESLARVLEDQGGQSHENAVAPDVTQRFTSMVMGNDTVREQEFDREMAVQFHAEAQGIRDQVVPLIQELAKSLNIELKKPLRQLE